MGWNHQPVYLFQSSWPNNPQICKKPICKDEGCQGAQPEAMNSNKSFEYPYTTDVFRQSRQCFQDVQAEIYQKHVI